MRLTGDWVLLAGAAAIVVASAVLNVSHGTVSLDADGAWPVPGACTFKRLTGTDCPSCGMTRSFVAMGHLDLDAAWRHHRLGPLVFAFVLLQIPYRGARLLWPSFARVSARYDFNANAGVLLVLFVLLVVSWVLRLVGV